MASAGDAGERLTSSDKGSSECQSARRTGRCKWFNVVKGFGFITPDDGQPDVFLHQTVIQMNGFRSLAEGELVEFEAKSCDKGFEATLVCGLGGSECTGTERRPVGKRKSRKIRCYNCGEFANHVAAKCPIGTQPKRCHHCKSDGHLIADCPDRQHQQEADVQTSDSSPQSSSSQQQQQPPPRGSATPSGIDRHHGRRHKGSSAGKGKPSVNETPQT